MAEIQKITLKNIRIVYPHLQTKGMYEGKEHEKYQADFIIAKDHPQIKDLQNAIREQMNILKEENKKTTFEFRKDIQCLVDGDTLNSDHYKGSFRLRGKSKNPVPMYDNYKKPIVDEKVIQGGDYVNAQFTFWGVTTQKGIIGCNLLAVVKLADGERIGGMSVDTNELFDGVEVSDDIADLPY